MANSEKQRPPSGPGPHSRVEDEVLEILSRVERQTSPVDRVRWTTGRRWGNWRARLAARTRAGAAAAERGYFFIACFAVAIVADVVHDTSALLARLLAAVSVALLIAPIVMHLRGPRRPAVKTWRGRDIDFGSGSGPSLDSFRSRFRKPPRR